MSTTYFEEDYRPVVAKAAAGRFLPGSSIETIRELGSRQPLRHVLFDFDGTLSLIREGWMNVMVPMMVETLAATGTRESAHTLGEMVREFVMELTGKQTIYQMMRLAEEVTKRGGTPQEPIVYKQIYHDRLMERIADRREALRSGRASPEEMLVPSSRPLLDGLRRQGVELYVASGTDEPYVMEEVRLLGLDEYFGPHVYGARDDYRTFSKAMVIDRILKENHVPGRSSWALATGTWKFRTSRPSAAWPSPWPATRPSGAASRTPGNASGSSAPAPTWSSPTTRTISRCWRTCGTRVRRVDQAQRCPTTYLTIIPGGSSLRSTHPTFASDKLRFARHGHGIAALGVGQNRRRGVEGVAGRGQLLLRVDRLLPGEHLAGVIDHPPQDRQH